MPTTNSSHFIHMKQICGIYKCRYSSLSNKIKISSICSGTPERSFFNVQNEITIIKIQVYLKERIEINFLFVFSLFASFILISFLFIPIFYSFCFAPTRACVFFQSIANSLLTGDGVAVVYIHFFFILLSSINETLHEVEHTFAVSMPFTFVGTFHNGVALYIVWARSECIWLCSGVKKRAPLSYTFHIANDPWKWVRDSSCIGVCYNEKRKMNFLIYHGS